MAEPLTLQVVDGVATVIIDNPDGTYGQGLETYSFRTAVGKGSVDKAAASFSDPLIQHVVVVQTR